MTFFADDLSPTEGFVIAPAHWFRDPRASLKLKGLLAYLKTHSRGYRCTVEQIIAETKESKDSVYRTLKEGRDLGYLLFIHPRDARNRPIRGASRYSWGPAAYEQQYKRAWTTKDDQSSEVKSASGNAGSGDPASDADASSQVGSASGFSASGESASGEAGSGNAETKKDQFLEKDQSSKEDHPDQPSVDQRGSTSSDESAPNPTAGSVQPALDGTVPGPRSGEAPSAKDVAFGVARAWVNHRAEIKKPVIVGGRKAGALHAVASLLAPFIEGGYTEDEVKRALNGLDIGCPSAGAFERALNRVRHGVQAPAGGGTNGARVNGRGRPSAEVLDVNAAWRDEPATASTGGATGW